MQGQWIDLRSDTVTRPTPEMRAAMAAAEVGDDVYLEDPTVNRLQERAAEILGKEASLFVPSGTMGNQIALRLHTCPGQEVVTESRGHIFNCEMAAAAVVSGVQARPVSAPTGILGWSAIEKALRGGPYDRARTGLITLENTHNFAGGTAYSPEVTEEICREAHARNLPVHLDGARIFNAAVALGTDAAALCRPVDSVMCCLSKGLCAPVGSLLAGSKPFIEEGRRIRKMMGGGMRQAGVLAAAGLIAIEKMTVRLKEDHENARLLAERLAATALPDLDPFKVLTNIIIINLGGTGLASHALASALKERGLLVGIVDEETIRLLTHHDVSRAQAVKAAEIMDETLRSLSGARR